MNGRKLGTEVRESSVRVRVKKPWRRDLLASERGADAVFAAEAIGERAAAGFERFGRPARRIEFGRRAEVRSTALPGTTDALDP